MGKFIEANLAGVVDARWGNFIRVKVKVSVTKPLQNGFWLERLSLDDL
jgi:hypothetical protein